MSSNLRNGTNQGRSVSLMTNEADILYRSLYENLDDGFELLEVVRDAENKPYDVCTIALNRACEELTGKRSDHIIGRTWSELAVEPSLFEVVFRVAESGRAERHEGHVKLKDRFFEASYFKVSEDRVGVLLRDVSDRKRAEEILKFSLKKYQDLVETANDVIYEIDAQGNFTYLSPQAQGMFGVEVKDILGTNFFEMMPDDGEESQEDKIENLRTILSSPKPLKGLELSFLDADGNKRHTETNAVPFFDDEGKLLGFRGVSRDITERKKNEQELKLRTAEVASERERLYEVLDTLPVDICLMTPDYHVVFANRAFRERFGESNGRRCYEFCCGFEEPCGFCESFEPLKTGKPHYWQYAPPDGAFTIDVYDFPFKDIDGSPLVLEMHIDITEQIKAKREAEEYAERLKRSNEELQQFAYVASHDLQEPLRMVTSYIRLLGKKFGEDLPPQAKEYMSYAFDGSVRMKELIDDLLAYSRIDSRPAVLEEIDMNEKARAVIEDLHVAIKEAGAEVVVNPLPMVCADRTQMKQLLTNLISNAIKFHSDKRPRVEVSAVTCGNDFVFSVEDNGIGIDPEYADKLFKMFSRLHTREEYPGTGIGLAVSKKIVERHGGRIWFESEPGEGTTFYFTVPCRGRDEN